MGKNQHSKAPMHITASEWAVEWGGNKSDRAATRVKRLPFDCCAISLTPFEDPFCAPDGAVFDLLNIVPFLKKFRQHPLTGEPLSAKELTRLHFHKDADGKYQCPVLFKPFNENTKIVAVRPTGNVYSYAAVQQLCLRPGNLRDLLTEEPFTPSDLIVLYDPEDDERRNIDRFVHVRKKLKAHEGDDGSIRANPTASRILERVSAERGAGGAAAGAAGAVAAGSARAAGAGAAGAERAGRALDGSAPDSLTTYRRTTHHCAAGFTSTTFAPVTTNAIAPLTAAELEAKRYARVKALGQKAYVQLSTSLGGLNLELHVDLAPRTCENFLNRCATGYYDGVKFHRLIKNFMVQGGDPTGTGKGGESMWGKPFADEIARRLSHTGRGIVSMANSGPDSNGSQFFITFKSCTHLDGKHAIFGRVVGGGSVLDEIERLPTDAEERPRKELRIERAAVFANPFDVVDSEPAAAAPAPAPAVAPRAARADRPTPLHDGVGKYLPASAFTASHAPDRGAADDGSDEEERRAGGKGKRLRSELTDFSAW